MTGHEFTADQIIHGIVDRVRAGDWDVAESLIHLLGVWYPVEFHQLRKQTEDAHLLHQAAARLVSE